MPDFLSTPPMTQVEPVTEVLYGISVTDPYRWLEDQESPRTRDWVETQAQFAHEYLDSIPGRDLIRDRIREFLEIETYDSILIHDGSYIFRKRLPSQEQPCIYIRESADSAERLLIDPTSMRGSKYTAVKPLAISPDGKMLAYEVKEGGERSSQIEFVDVLSGTKLPDSLARGLLRAFAFAPDSRGFYYAQDPVDQTLPPTSAILHHQMGTPSNEDLLIFQAADAPECRVGVIADSDFLLILVSRFSERKTLDCYLRPLDSAAPTVQLADSIDYLFAPQIVNGRMFILTNLAAPNLRICELRMGPDGARELVEVISTRDAMIQRWIIIRENIAVSYVAGTCFRFVLFDLSGKEVGEIPLREDESASLLAGDSQNSEVVFQSESFFESPVIYRYSLVKNERFRWSGRSCILDRSLYTHKRVVYPSKDGTNVPMFLVGRRDVFERGSNPAILTSYGGFRHVMTPQFSVLVSILMERGCIFALPNIRGGAEYGEAWHAAAKRHLRQNAFDDFLSAAEWLINTGVADAGRIGIFGGSNSGLLVGVAMTQAPQLFRAVLFNAPLLDMIRYHLFNGAGKWKDEFGTAEDATDFNALFGYSPYHRVRQDTGYPAVMMVSGDSDQNCNPLHARKMIARLQAANTSSHPIILDYSPYRGHSPVLPLSTRVDALTDRLAFFCDQFSLR